MSGGQRISSRISVSVCRRLYCGDHFPVNPTRTFNTVQVHRSNSPRRLKSAARWTRVENALPSRMTAMSQCSTGMAKDAAGSCTFTPEGSHNLPTIGSVFCPTRARSDFVVHVFFKEPAILQRICETKMGRSSNHRCCARSRSTLRQQQGMASFAQSSCSERKCAHGRYPPAVCCK